MSPHVDRSTLGLDLLDRCPDRLGVGNVKRDHDGLAPGSPDIVSSSRSPFSPRAINTMVAPRAANARALTRPLSPEAPVIARICGMCFLSSKAWWRAGTCWISRPGTIGERCASAAGMR